MHRIPSDKLIERTSNLVGAVPHDSLTVIDLHFATNLIVGRE